MTAKREVEKVAGGFALAGRLRDAKPFHGGHINDSFVLTCEQDGRSRRYLLQRINDSVFTSPAQVMANIQHVTDHIACKLKVAGAFDLDRRVLTLVPTRAGQPYCRDEAGGFWRIYHFIEGATVRESVTTPLHAEQAGRAFGEFQRLVADYAGPRLHETIPGFHDTRSRYDALTCAIAADPCSRVASAGGEIEFAQSRRDLAGVLLDLQAAGEIPERVVHYDAKMTNVLFDERTDERLCVVDLDTVMPGLAVLDFGDMVRSMTSPSAEDEPDLSKVGLRLDFFEALTRGYLAETNTFLTQAERENLVFAGKLITLEQGVRFLADYLNGDTYYKTSRPDHNLDRCRTQFKLVDSIERNEAALTAIVGGS